MGNIKLKIGSIFDVAKGTLQSSKNTPGNYSFITASSEWKTHTTYTHDCEALVFAMAASGSLGRTHYINGQFIASDLCFIITAKDGLKDKISLRFFYHYFNAIKDEIVKATATGTSKLAINTKNFINYEIYLPDINTQLLLIKTIEQAKTIAEQFDKYSEESLGYLSLLRQAVLQEAIQGNLVEQNPDDEPASLLLEKIQEEKERLIEEKKIKFEKPLPPITKDETPFELPKGWEWVRLGDVALKIVDGTHHSPPSFPSGKYMYITAKNIKEGGIDLCNITFVSENEHKKIFQRCDVQYNDILLIKDGATTGIVTVNKIKEEFSLLSSVAIIRVNELLVIPEYIAYALKSPVVRNIMLKTMSGSAITRLTLSKIKNILLPIPPTSFQKEAINKLNNLMFYCNSLSSEILKSKSHSEKLIGVVLKDAFLNESRSKY